MCGRFTLTIPDFETLAEALGVTLSADPEAAAAAAALYRPRYNVAPTDPHPILRVKDDRRELVPARWGLVNSWAKDATGAFRQINARSETAARTPAFRDAFERRRCIVPADGFFEWIGPKTARRPIWFHARSGPGAEGAEGPGDADDGERSASRDDPAGDGRPALLHLAGLYESWRDPETDTWLRTFTILTVAANDVVSMAHDRMPVVLAPEDVGPWLHGGGSALLQPAPSERLIATFVSPRANSVKNDDPACLEEVPPDPAALAEAALPRPPQKRRGRAAPRPATPAAPTEVGPLFAARPRRS